MDLEVTINKKIRSDVTYSEDENSNIRYTVYFYNRGFLLEVFKYPESIKIF